MAVDDPSNPWSASGWNVTQQGAYHQQHGPARAEARARDAGTSVGGQRPGGGGGGRKAAASGSAPGENKTILLKHIYNNDGWSPQLAIEVDGTDGGGGGTGLDGWSPEVAVVTDGARRVLQVVDWTGGSGTPPASPVYIGATGFTSVLADAVDVRGSAGSPGSNGVDGATWRDGTGAPAAGLGANGDYYLDDATGDVYKKAAGSYSVVGNIKGPAGSAGSPGPATSTRSPMNFSSTTTDAAPGDGIFRLSVANPGTVGTCVIYTGLKDSSAADITAMLDAIQTSDPQRETTIKIYKQSDNKLWITGRITAVTTATGYRKLTIDILSTISSSPLFTNGDACFMQIDTLQDGRIPLAPLMFVTPFYQQGFPNLMACANDVAATGGSATTHMTPFWVEHPWYLKEINVMVTILAASTNYRFGLFKMTHILGAMPVFGAKVFDSGLLTNFTPSTGLKTQTVDVVYPPGYYAFVWSKTTNQPTVRILRCKHPSGGLTYQSASPDFSYIGTLAYTVTDLATNGYSDPGILPSGVFAAGGGSMNNTFQGNFLDCYATLKWCPAG